jgi:hypothetical protein
MALDEQIFRVNKYSGNIDFSRGFVLPRGFPPPFVRLDMIAFTTTGMTID